MLLIAASPDLKLTTELVVALDAASPNNIQDLFYFVFGLTEVTAIPTWLCEMAIVGEGAEEEGQRFGATR